MGEPAETPNRPVLDVRDLRVTFDTPAGPVRAVRGVDFSVGPGEVLGVVGESGSGKSVSAMAVIGLLPDTADVEGSVRYRGKELVGLSDKELCQLRGEEIAMIFQDPFTSLNPVQTVGDQIAEAVEVHHPDVGRQPATQRAVELLDLVGIPNAKERAEQYPHEFSGGMRQRVIIAMAIANDPDVLIADEPTTALDVTVQAQILDVLEKAQEATHSAIILISHNLGMVAGMADRVQVMYAGAVVETGSVLDVFGSPRHPYTLGLLQAVPRLDAEGRAGARAAPQSGGHRLQPIVGNPPNLLRPPVGCAFHPRCPLAQRICEEETPALRPVGALGQQSACHFAEDVGTTPTYENQ